MAETIEQFGQRIKTKYQEYSDMSDAELGQKILAKYPEYQDMVSTSSKPIQPKPQGGPSFPAQMGGSETIIGNVARTFGNIPSSAANLARAVVAPVNPFDLNSPLNIGSNIVKGGEALGQIFKSKTPLRDVGEGFVQTGKDISSAVARFGQQAVQDPSSIAKVGIEDPLLVPSLLYAPSKALGVRASFNPLKSVGQAIEKSGNTGVAKTKQKFSEKLVSPERTPTVKREQVSRTTETGVGPFIRSRVQPTPQETRMAVEVAKIPGVKEGASFQRNYNAVRDYIIQKAKQLEADISANDFIVPRREIISRLEKAKEGLANSPTIVGDAQTTADRLLAGAIRILNENPGTGSGLLSARKQYDEWVLSQKPKAFDGKTENAFTLANREVRNTLNDSLHQYATNVNTRASLDSQATLYRALDNIENKAAKEADTALGRMFDNVGQILNTRSRVVQGIGVVSGVGVFGAATTYALPFTLASATGYTMYLGGKLILKPQTRQMIGQFLSGSKDVLPAKYSKILQQMLIPNAPIEDLLVQLEEPKRVFKGSSDST